MKNDNYHITPIQTMYCGRLYRSRLEAKWACFFNLLKWNYEYEPFDLKGWSPDFMLRLPMPALTHVGEVLVEVKPSSMVNIDLHYKMQNSSSKTNYNLLLLLETPLTKIENINFGFSGRMPSFNKKTFTYKHKNKKFSEFCGIKLCEHKSGVYSIMQWDNPESEDSHWSEVPVEYIENMWNEACNEVMFLKK